MSLADVIPAARTATPLQLLSVLLDDADQPLDPLRRTALANDVNALLRTMHRPGTEAALAAALTAELEGTRLDSLVDRDGHSCRTVAVQQLLELGFPYALSVSPADLEQAREGQFAFVPEQVPEAPRAPVLTTSRVTAGIATVAAAAMSWQARDEQMALLLPLVFVGVEWAVDAFLRKTKH